MIDPVILVLVIVAGIWLSIVLFALFRRRIGAMLIALAAPSVPVLVHLLAVHLPWMQHSGWAPTFLADVIGAVAGGLLLLGALVATIRGGSSDAASPPARDGHGSEGEGYDADHDRPDRSAARCSVSAEELADLCGSTDSVARRLVVQNSSTSPATLARLSTDGSVLVRRAVAHNPRTPPHALTAMMEHDPDLEVRLIAGSRLAGRSDRDLEVPAS